MATTPKSATILSRCRVAPPCGCPQLSLPVTFYDMLWLHFHPIQRVLFYKFPCSTSHFLEFVVPHFTKSLSQTLKHFLPLSGNLIYPTTTTNACMPEFRYTPGDSVSVTIAESNQASDFNYLTGNGPRNADEFYPFVPDLPQSKFEPQTGLKSIPLFSVQLTLFPDTGICFGFTNHHGIGDASSIVGFIKAWSSIAKLGDDTNVKHILPFYDRSVIKDPSGVANTYWKQRNVFKIESPPLTLPTKNFRSMYILRKDDLQMLKDSVLAKNADTYLSSFSITSAYVWTCLVKCASVAGEEVDDNEAEYFCFTVDMRRRLDPPLPGVYFGNCVALVMTESTHGRLKKDNGFFVAVELIGELMTTKVNDREEILRDSEHWMSKYGTSMAGKRAFGIAGSPRFDVYDVDFGWGKPEKYEAVSIDGDGGSMSLCKSREFEGGLEIGLSLPKRKMDAFATIFDNGLKI